MGRRGPPAKPTKLKVLQGTFRKDRASSKEPTPNPEIPKVPKHLSDEAKVEWGRIAQELHQLGLLSRIDRAALAAYCQAWSNWVTACEAIDKSAPIIKTPVKRTITGQGAKQRIVETGGHPIVNPYVSIANKSLDQMKSFLTEFGMTPAARTRIDVEPPGPADTEKSDKNNAWSNL